MKIKALLYCTKAKPMLRIAKEEFKGQKRARCYTKEETEYFTQYIEEEMYEANGKIVAECDFEVDEIETYYNNQIYEGCRVHTINAYNVSKLLELTCLSQKQLDDYLGENNGKAIHIKNLHIFDKPKELSEYRRKDEFMGGKQVFWEAIKKAPQNMMYAYDEKGNMYVLISIQPQWLCKILNGEKTIEVRKKVLKEMLKDE